MNLLKESIVTEIMFNFFYLHLQTSSQNHERLNSFCFENKFVSIIAGQYGQLFILILMLKVPNGIQRLKKIQLV